METLRKKSNTFSLNKESGFQVYTNNIIKNRSQIASNLKYDKRRAILSIKSELLVKDNYHISLVNEKLILLISENREISKPIHIHNLKSNFINNWYIIFFFFFFLYTGGNIR
jgi:spore coat polysaccharide biosynthesis predicted glycosyltransferase SpsG